MQLIESWWGRSGRPEFWGSVALLIAISYVSVYLANLPGPGLFTLVFWQYVYARRLHDIDRTAWWGVAVLAVSFIPLALAFFFAGDEVQALLLEQTEQASRAGWFWYFTGMYGEIVIQHGFTIWLGFQKGDPVDNRFGDWPRPLRWPWRSKT